MNYFIFFVDNNNLARRFGDEKSQSWVRKDNSCPESSKDLTDEEFNKLRNFLANYISLEINDEKKKNIL